MLKNHFVKGLASLAVAGAMLVTSAANASIYVNAPGIPGESTATGHAGEIDMTTAKFGVSNNMHAVPNGSATFAGKAAFTEMTLTKPSDKSSMVWFTAAASGRAIGTVVVTFTRNIGSTSNQTYYKVTLTNVMVTECNFADTGSGGVETIGLTFTKVQVQYTTSTGVNSTTGWDIARNAQA